MSTFSMLDLCCLSVIAKYKTPVQISAQILGQHYADFLWVEVASKQKVVPARYIPCHFPFEGYRAFHFSYGESGFIVLYESIEDDVHEQLKSRLHEVGEIIRDRLRKLWPEYRLISEVEDIIVGDAWGDDFADAAIPECASLVGNLATDLRNLVIQLFPELEDLLEASRQACKPLKPFLLAYLIESARGMRSILSDIGEAVVNFIQALVNLIVEILERCCQCAGKLIESQVTLVEEYVRALIGEKGAQ